MALCMQRDSVLNRLMDCGKYVRYTPEQVEALERVYAECPKPSSSRRQQLIRECPILSNIEQKQIKVWFQNRRCREKQRKEASRLQTVNRKLSAMNKLLMEENDRLQKQVSQLVYDNGYMKQQIHTASATTTDNSCESVVVSGQNQQQNPKTQHPQWDANNPAGLFAIAQETLAAFLSKATGTAINWVQMIGMKPGPDSIGIVAVSPNCSGVAARACGLVSLEPTKVAEILKDRPSWYRDCRCLNVLSVVPTGNGGTIELMYMQTYAPTTLAAARDFWTLRYTTTLEDGSLVICERSLTSSTGGPTGPPALNFVRAEVLPSGYLIRSCEGGGSIIHIVDHMDLDVWSVPEVLRPLYESSKFLAQKLTTSALRHVRQIAQESSGEVHCGGGRQPAVLRTFSQRLCKGFNDAVNGFVFDSICKFSFGLDPKCLEQSLPISDFARSFDMASKLSAERAMSVSPLIWKIKRFLNVGSEKKLQEAVKTINILAKEVIRQRRKMEFWSHEDLLSRFMSCVNDDTYLKDIIVSFLLAGRDTVASALTTFFWLLTKHPEVVSKIVVEAEGVIGREKSKDIASFEELQELHYLEAAAYESMRLYPPIQLDSKFCLEDDVLPDGTFVKRGTRVSYHPYAMGRLEELWGRDCLEFRPERWLKNGVFCPENPFKYPVFQAGMRVCLGKEMALLELKSVAISVLRRFHIELVAPDHRTPRFSPGLTATLSSGLRVKVRDQGTQQQQHPLLLHKRSI